MNDRNHWAGFSWEDPFLFDEQLSNEERLTKESAKKFADSVLAPRVVQDYRDEASDRHLFKQMGEQGLLGAMIEGYGCAGMSYTSYGLIAREIERIDSGYRSMMSVQSSLVIP